MPELRYVLADVRSEDVKALRIEVPSEKDRSTLKAQDHAQLLFLEGGKKELLWAEVTGAWPHGQYAAILRSGPTKIRGISQGYRLVFRTSNVIKIYKGGRDSFAS